MKITVFGVDRRFVYAERLLAGEGFETERYAPGVSLAPILLLPVPASRDGVTVAGHPDVLLGNLLSGDAKLILGGNLSGEFTAAARRAGVAVRDYMNVEEFARS